MKKSDKIKIICGISAAVLMCSVSIGISLAYLSDRESRDNNIVVGHGDASIIEEKSEPTELSMLNEPLKKEYSVSNDSTVVSFARLYAEFSNSKVAEHIQVNYRDENGETRTVLWNDFKAGLAKNEGEEGYISSDWRYIVNDSNDELNEYFYYTKPLMPGESTPPLITDVILDYRRFNDESVVIDDSNIDRISNISKVVYAELVQTTETGEKDGKYGYDYASVPTDPDDPDSPVSVNWKEAWVSFLVRN